MIQEVIVTTTNMDGSTHIAPMGVRQLSDRVVIAPFKPSLTLTNIQNNKTAVVNYTDDVRIFAGCLTGKKNWPLLCSDKIVDKRLASALCHVELKLKRLEDDDLRPCLYCYPIHEAMHRPFKGFNRAQAAVIEAAILVSRFSMLPIGKIRREIEYLDIAIDKTAGDNEKLAWSWLMEKIALLNNERNESA